MGGATVPYLRRRPPHKPAPREVAAAPSLSLALRQPDTARTLRTIPHVKGPSRLDSSSPMVVLDRLQSAIGCLQVHIEPAVAWTGVLWELTDGRAGTFDDVALDPGRRPFVSGSSRHDAAEYVIGLRHSRQLRRVVIGIPPDPARAAAPPSGPAAAPVNGAPVIAPPPVAVAGPLSVELFDGTIVACAAGTTALAVYQLEGQLYLRADTTPYASAAALRTAYGI